MSDSEQITVYQLKIFILGISPMIWRRFKVHSNSTITDLHYIIQLVMGTPSVQPLYGDEIRSLRKLQRDYPASPYVFQSSRSGPLAHDTVGGIVERAGELAALPMPVHAHMLRHGTGYYLANRGIDTRTIQSYLGHNNIQHTVRYTELASPSFKGCGMVDRSVVNSVVYLPRKKSLSMGMPVCGMSIVEFGKYDPLLKVLADRSHLTDRLRDLSGT